MKSAFSVIRVAIAWRWWVFGYEMAAAKQWFRSAVKQSIMRAVNQTNALGEWLIRALGLGDC